MTTPDKERIARKAGGASAYPFCTGWWVNLPREKKEWIKSHCEEKHGLITPMWNEGEMFSE